MPGFIPLIRKYRLDELLYRFANMSIKMFKANKSSITIPMVIKQLGYFKKVEVGVSVWDILSIEYIAVCNSNDYRSKSIGSDQDISEIINEYRGFENDNSGSEILEDASLKELFKFMFGISTEQFLFFNMSWVFESYNRNYHILKKTKTQIQGTGINIDEITMEKFGLTSDEFISVMLILFWLCMQHPDPLSAPEELYMKTSGTVLKKENLKKIVDHYSCSYLDIRQSPLKRQLLYSKPFIKTDGLKYIASSMHLVAMAIADGLYWIVRNYYSEKNSQKFTNTFGYMFEEYFCELADRYLDKDQFKKLPQENNQKGADYKIEFNNAILIIEQKSALLGLNAKQQIPDFECIDNFYIRNVIEAYEQIQSTLKGAKEEKPILKIILLYENFFNTGLIEASIPEIFEKDRSCWIMTIRDFEILFVTYKKDSVKCSEVISKLLTNKQENLTSSQSALSLLDEMMLLHNSVFEGEFDHFQMAMKRLAFDLDEDNIEL